MLLCMVIDAKPLPGYPEPYDLLAAILNDGTNEWRWELDPKLGEETMGWQPHPGFHSIGSIILHIAAVDRVIDSRVRSRMRSCRSKYHWSGWRRGVGQDHASTSISSAIRSLRSSGIAGLIEHESLEPEHLWPAPDTLKEWDGTQRTMRWVFGHVIQHEAYHGGQAVLLSRMWELSR